MRHIITTICFTLLLNPFKLIAQNNQQHSGWFALIHSQKITEKFGAHFDFQARSADEFDYLRNIIVRPGITYFLDNTKNTTLGYALILTNQELQAPSTLDKQLTEHRIWQQFIYNQKVNKLTLTHRLRLEQRFIETNTDDVFSNRIRYFIRTVLPLTKQEGKFTNGIFASLQNEVFLNLQNKEKLNGHTFDQNRAYAALGYRITPKIDIEAGYLNQAIKGSTANTTNNIAQLAFYTRF